MHHGFQFIEDSIAIRTLKTRKEKCQAYQLRKKIFCDNLNWVKPSGYDMEFDEYDNYATLMGVFNESGLLLATFRIISALYPLMIENEFRSLIGDQHTIIKNQYAAEISRLCVDHQLTTEGMPKISHHLYKTIYYFCLHYKLRYLYMVVEEKMLRKLQKQGYPCCRIGQTYSFSSGISTLAAILDWNEYSHYSDLLLTHSQVNDLELNRFCNSVPTSTSI